MKVAVECRSPLLQKSLEMFLSKYLSSSKQCDILIRDIKCLEDPRCFYIASSKNADLKKPFSKSQLIMALQKRYDAENTDIKVEDKEESSSEEGNFDFSILEKRIELLTQEYQKNILKAVRAFYEK